MFLLAARFFAGAFFDRTSALLAAAFCPAFSVLVFAQRAATAAPGTLPAFLLCHFFRTGFTALAADCCRIDERHLHHSIRSRYVRKDFCIIPGSLVLTIERCAECVPYMASIPTAWKPLK
jgi:hypothetical protein